MGQVRNGILSNRSKPWDMEHRKDFFALFATSIFQPLDSPIARAYMTWLEGSFPVQESAA
jgi:hypothetical protein